MKAERQCGTRGTPRSVCGKGGNERDSGHVRLVFQNFNLFPHYSVLKNITDAPIHVQKRKREEAEAEARELLAKMGLSDKADMYPCQLSGGQQQRVAIARAWLCIPGFCSLTSPPQPWIRS